MVAAKVLVVEDERIVALDLKRQLVKLGYDVPAMVASGERALETVRSMKPDLVLMDVHLEGQIDGIETARRIVDTMPVPIVFLTAYSDEGTIGRARATHPYGYLLKPLSEQELHATIQVALERHRSDTTLAASEARLRLAMDAAQLGTWEWDASDPTIFRYRQGAGAEQAACADVRARLHPDDLAPFCLSLRELRAIPNIPRRIEFRVTESDGAVRWLQLYATTYAGEHEATRTVGVVQDITERKQADLRLQESEARFRAAAETMIDAFLMLECVRDDAGRVIDFRLDFLNRRAEEMTGLLLEEVRHMRLSQLIPIHLIDGWFDKYRRVVDAGEPLDEEVTFGPPGPQLRWLQHQAVRVGDGIAVFANDVTARKRAEAALAVSEQQLRTITDNVPALISYVDREQVFRFANQAVAEWVQRPVADIVNRPARDIYGEAGYRFRQPYIERALAGERVEFEVEVIRSGKKYYATTTYIPHQSAQNEVIGFYALSHDITARKLVELELGHRARFDALTALPNRHEFGERLGRGIQRARRNGALLAVFYLDIDHFKTINDTLGHDAGDRVLQAFARRLSACVRATDTVARLAGDEFTMMLEGLNTPATAEIVARKVIQAMLPDIELGDATLTVTTSIGIAFLRDEMSAQELIKQADEALYRAKAAGRNTYSIAP